MDRGRPSQTSQVGLLRGSLLNNYPWSMFWWNTQDECCSFILLKETESKNRFFCILSLCTWVRLSPSTVVVRGGERGGRALSLLTGVNRILQGCVSVCMWSVDWRFAGMRWLRSVRVNRNESPDQMWLWATSLNTAMGDRDAKPFTSTSEFL